MLVVQQTGIRIQ